MESTSFTSRSRLSESGISIGSRKGIGYLRFNSETAAPGAGNAVFRNLSGTGRRLGLI